MAPPRNSKTPKSLCPIPDGEQPIFPDQEELLSNVGSLLKAVGEDPNREGLVRTPYRHLKAFRFLTHGYSVSIDKVVNGALFDVDYSEMVIVRNIEFYSLCEHHLLPFFGKCSVGYLPKGKILGLSKIPRIVDVFARRLQVQERLTSEISNCLMELLNPHGVGVVMEASHLCMMMRGVEKQNAFAQTSTLLGDFRNPATRAEFFNLIK
jgi:GTP cyclohydrolase IA